MDLLDEVERLVGLGDLVEEVRKNASPVTLTNLAQRIYTVGETDIAFRVAAHALSLFPESDRVRSTYQSIRKEQLQSQISTLTKEIEENPTARAMARLAAIYYDQMGLSDRAWEICHQALEEHGDDEDVHQLLGKIRMDRFHQSFRAQDGMAAYEHLSKAIEANPMHYKARIFLSKLHLEIGAGNLALAQLEEILRQAPDDQASAVLIEKARELGGEVTEKQLPWVFSDIESRGGLTPQEQKRASSGHGISGILRPRETQRIDKANLSDKLGRFASVEEVRVAVVLNDSGIVEAQFARDDSEDSDIGTLTHEVHKASQDASLRMQVGGLVQVTVEGPFGTLLVRTLADMILGVLITGGRIPRVEREVEEFMGSVIRMAPADAGEGG